MYRCNRCNRILKKLEPDRVRCPFCGSRILFKERPKIVRNVKAK